MFSKSKTNITCLKLAVQKSGRLYQDSIDLIKRCGISFERADNRLMARAKNFALEILYLRDDDIPEYVADGVADVGIVGENIIVEKQRDLMLLERLDFGSCRLSIACPQAFAYSGPEDLSGLRIASSYPNTLRRFLESKQVRATICEVSGATEIAPSVNLSDAVCDLVSSGSTLLSNGLKEVEVILESQAMLVCGSELSQGKQDLLGRLRFRIAAVQKANSSKYVVLNAPDQALSRISELLPGLRSPTVIPLATPGWSSLHSVINENDFWAVIESLKENGAEGILVMPIEKMIC